MDNNDNPGAGKSPAIAERLGDAPIEAELKVQLNELGDLMNRALNRDGKGRWGFCLMVFPFENFEGRCNYISNARRADVVVLLKEQLARFEGQPEITGRA